MAITLDTAGVSVLVDKVSTGYGHIDFSIPGEDLSFFRAGQRAGEAMGEGELIIDNEGFQYSHLDSSTEITVGDKLIFVADLPETPTGFGVGPFGAGAFGETTFDQLDPIGTYRVLDWDIIDHGTGQSDYALKLGEFVHAALQATTVYHTEADLPLSGSEDAILDTVLATYAPEVDRSLLPTINRHYDYYASGVDGATAVNELAAYAADGGAPVVQSSEGDSLVFEPIPDIDERADVTLDHLSPPASASETHDLVNEVRVEGGIDDEGNLEQNPQEEVHHYERATESDPIVTQVETRKSQISSVDLWTRGERADMSNKVRIRFQESNDAGTGPVAINDPDSDIVSTNAEEIEGVEDTWRSFSMPPNTNREREPWLIIETDGDTGHEIGVNISNVPAYRIYFPKPVAIVLADTRSQAKYGVYRKHIRDEALASGNAVRSRARAALDQHAWPNLTLGPLECVEDVAHTLRVGEILRINRPGLRTVGDYLVTEKTDTYEAASLHTEVKLTEVERYA